jgi:hypothetical protein
MTLADWAEQAYQIATSSGWAEVEKLGVLTTLARKVADEAVADVAEGLRQESLRLRAVLVEVHDNSGDPAIRHLIQAALVEEQR